MGMSLLQIIWEYGAGLMVTNLPDQASLMHDQEVIRTVIINIHVLIAHIKSIRSWYTEYASQHGWSPESLRNTRQIRDDTYILTQKLYEAEEGFYTLNRQLINLNESNIPDKFLVSYILM